VAARPDLAGSGGAEDRLERLDAAATIAAREPATMLTGHLRDRLPEAVQVSCRRSTRRGKARGRFLLSLDGRPVAWTAPHGGRIDWFAPPAGR